MSPPGRGRRIRKDFIGGSSSSGSLSGGVGVIRNNDGRAEEGEGELERDVASALAWIADFEDMGADGDEEE